MLRTKDIPVSSGKTPKTIKPGNLNAKILEITLQPLKNDPQAFYLMLHLEGEDQGAEFEGFLYDKDNPNKGRAKGQVGKIRYSAYPYRDGVTKTGRTKNRDFDILRSLSEIANIAGKKEELDAIEGNDIIDFVKKASKLLSSDQFYYWCIGGSAYMKDDGNKDFSLHLPRYDKNFKNFEPVGTEPSKVAKFDYATHVEDNIEVEATKSEVESWTPSSFNL